MTLTRFFLISSFVELEVFAAAAETPAIVALADTRLPSVLDLILESVSTAVLAAPSILDGIEFVFVFVGWNGQDGVESAGSASVRQCQR